VSRGKTDPETGLTARQRAFAEAYVRLGVGAKAAREAGYSQHRSEQTAHELLNAPKYKPVQDYIRRLAEETRRESIADIVELREFWTRTLRAKEADADFNARLRASEMLGKSLGAFIERRELSGPGGGAIQAVVNLTLATTDG
jgi:phage terminase small subunit